MNLDEAVKLVITLHTPSEKLQREIIAKDIDLASLIENARAIESHKEKLVLSSRIQLRPACTK